MKKVFNTAFARFMVCGFLFLFGLSAGTNAQVSQVGPMVDTNDYSEESAMEVDRQMLLALIPPTDFSQTFITVKLYMQSLNAADDNSDDKAYYNVLFGEILLDELAVRNDLRLAFYHSHVKFTTSPDVADKGDAFAKPIMEGYANLFQ